MTRLILTPSQEVMTWGALTTDWVKQMASGYRLINTRDEIESRVNSLFLTQESLHSSRFGLVLLLK